MFDIKSYKTTADLVKAVKWCLDNDTFIDVVDESNYVLEFKQGAVGDTISVAFSNYTVVVILSERLKMIQCMVSGTGLSTIQLSAEDTLKVMSVLNETIFAWQRGVKEEITLESLEVVALEN